MKYIFILLLILVSCQSKEKSPAITGTWEFERNELFPGVQINTFQDSMLNMLEEQQKGLTLSFKGTNFKASQFKDGREEPMGNQPFVWEEKNKVLVLKNNGRPDDRFDIIELSDSLLKLNLFHSKEGYLVFRKKKK